MFLSTLTNESNKTKQVNAQNRNIIYLIYTRMDRKKHLGCMKYKDRNSDFKCLYVDDSVIYVHEIILFLPDESYLQIRKKKNINMDGKEKERKWKGRS